MNSALRILVTLAVIAGVLAFATYSPGQLFFWLIGIIAVLGAVVLAIGIQSWGDSKAGIPIFIGTVLILLMGLLWLVRHVAHHGISFTWSVSIPPIV